MKLVADAEKPIDPRLAKARDIAALVFEKDGLYNLARWMRKGINDDGPVVQAALLAIIDAESKEALPLDDTGGTP